MVERPERPTKVFSKTSVWRVHLKKPALIMKIHKADLQFVPVDADADFDPEHNRRVIEKTIRDSERIRRQKNREFGEKIAERADAAAHFLKGLSEGKTSTSVEKYFGRRELARLRGQEIIKSLQK